MTDPRWTEEVETAVAVLIGHLVSEVQGFDETDQGAARRVLGLLADVGVLIQPGSKIKEEWGLRYLEGPEPEQVIPYGDGAGPFTLLTGKHIVARLINDRRDTRIPMRRVTTTSPWHEAEPHDR